MTNNLTVDQLAAADSISNKVLDFETVIFQKFYMYLLYSYFWRISSTAVHTVVQRERGTNLTFFSVLNCWIEQIYADQVTLSIGVYTVIHFLKACLQCASIQFSKNFLFPELKLKLHSFHQVQISSVMF